MSFRITTIAEGSETTIRVEGRLDTEGVPELRREIGLAEGAITLDLSGLTSADTAGLQELSELSERGIKLRSASPYIRQLLVGAS